MKTNVNLVPSLFVGLASLLLPSLSSVEPAAASQLTVQFRPDRRLRSGD